MHRINPSDFPEFLLLFAAEKEHQIVAMNVAKTLCFTEAFSIFSHKSVPKGVFDLASFYSAHVLETCAAKLGGNGPGLQIASWWDIQADLSLPHATSG